MSIRSILVLLLLLLTTAAYCQATHEFNWIPSGNLDVGNVESEDASDYRGMGEIIETPLTCSDKTRLGDNRGRRSTAEMFTVKIATYRGGPCPDALVIRRCIDTGTEPVELTVFVDGKEYSKWLRPTFEGERRLANVLFVIPKSDIMTGDKDNPQMRTEVVIKLIAEKPFDTFRYDFFITRDWDFLPQGYSGAINMRGGDSVADTYINALVKEGDHLWEDAKSLYKSVSEKSEDSELTRCARMRMRLCDYNLSAIKVMDTQENRNFDTHFVLGQYCASNGFWNEAMAQYTKAVEANPVHGDATYNLAEAMEFCRLPVEKWAPLMGRAGWLYNRKDVNDITVHATINTYELPDGNKRIKAMLSKESMDALTKDCNYIEQMVFGASRGAWKIKMIYEAYTPKDPKWDLHLNWLWAPPTSSIPKWGMYDHTLGFAEWGASDAGGIDCGPAWSGCANLGPTRSWEVILHEWNHQFDWTCIFGEQGRGYPTTHDSDGCGKQPIVSMGCGHRSSMRYYLRPAQYKRIEPSDADIPKTYIKVWSVTGPFDAPKLEGKTGEEILAELKSKKIATDAQVQEIRNAATNEKKDLADKAREWYWQGGRMDIVKAVDDESTFGPEIKDKGEWKATTDDDGQVDLAALFPKAGPKSFAYATTYIWSPDDREVRVWYGYHTGFRVWHNTRLVFNGNYYTCAYYADPKWMDMVAGHLSLKKGWNRLMCKVERCTGLDFYAVGKPGTWSFSVNLVDYNNNPLPDLKYQAEVPKESVNVYKRPDVGKYYAWDDVQEDYLEMLPQLTQDDFRKITGIPELITADNVYLMAVPAAKVQKGAKAITLDDIAKGIGDMNFEGIKVTPINFLDLPIPGTPQGQEPTGFNKLKAGMQTDVVFNNFLNYDREGAGALRYMENGKPYDLIFIRPEYLDEYLTLIDDSKSGMEGRTRDRILGYWFVQSAAYQTTGNRTWRAVVVAKTYLGEEYPKDEQDILTIPAATNAIAGK